MKKVSGVIEMFCIFKVSVGYMGTFAKTQQLTWSKSIHLPAYKFYLNKNKVNKWFK